MRIRSRLDQNVIEVQLEEARGVLVGRDVVGQELTVAPLEAAIGYELVSAAPNEEQELRAAGYLMPQPGKPDEPLDRLSRAMRMSRRQNRPDEQTRPVLRIRAPRLRRPGRITRAG